MAGPRTLEEVQSRLDAESAWRKKELGTLKLMLSRARPHENELLRRSAITLTYAHWEGYVKNALEIVLSYINRKALKLSEANVGLVARSIEPRLRAAVESKKRRPILDLISHIMDDGARCTLVLRIETASNLNRAVFDDLLSSFGLDPTKVIGAHGGVTDIDLDERLLAKRNQIAHGTYVVPEEEECRCLIEAVQTLIEYMGYYIVEFLDNEEFRRARA